VFGALQGEKLSFIRRYARQSRPLSQFDADITRYREQMTDIRNNDNEATVINFIKVDCSLLKVCVLLLCVLLLWECVCVCCCGSVCVVVLGVRVCCCLWEDALLRMFCCCCECCGSVCAMWVYLIARDVLYLREWHPPPRLCVCAYDWDCMSM